MDGKDVSQMWNALLIFSARSIHPFIQPRQWTNHITDPSTNQIVHDQKLRLICGLKSTKGKRN